MLILQCGQYHHANRSAAYSWQLLNHKVSDLSVLVSLLNDTSKKTKATDNQWLKSKKYWRWARVLTFLWGFFGGCGKGSFKPYFSPKSER